MPFKNRFLHGPEGWRCQPFPVEVFPVWVFSGTGWRRWQLRGWAAAGTLRLTRQCFTYRFEEVCSLLARGISSFGSPHFWRAVIWLLQECCMALGCLRVPACAWWWWCPSLLRWLVPTRFQEKMELVQPLLLLLCQIPSPAKMIRFICFSFACSEWN